MTLTTLQTLTWSTVTGAIVGALMLASGEPGPNQWAQMRQAQSPGRSTTASQTTGMQMKAAAPAMPSVESSRISVR